MSPFLHAVNIGTLALWLSAVGFGVVGVVTPGWRSPTPAPRRWNPG